MVKPLKNQYSFDIILLTKKYKERRFYHMYIISQISLFDNNQIEILGDLERLKLAIENIPDEKIIIALKKLRKNGRNDWPVEAM